MTSGSEEAAPLLPLSVLARGLSQHMLFVGQVSGLPATRAVALPDTLSSCSSFRALWGQVADLSWAGRKPALRRARIGAVLRNWLAGVALIALLHSPQVLTAQNQIGSFRGKRIVRIEYAPAQILDP